MLNPARAFRVRAVVFGDIKMTAVTNLTAQLNQNRTAENSQVIVCDVDLLVLALQELATGGVTPALPILDEGVQITPTPTSIDFVGAGVTATVVGNAVTVTVPGGASGTVPKFSATPNASQALVSGTPAKVIFQVEKFDTNGDFVPGAGATQSRFTASIAGFYLFTGTIRAGSSSSNITDMSLSFFVNGADAYRACSIKCPAVAAYACNGSALLSLGIGDFVELFGNVIATGPSFDFSGSAGAQCFFSGVFQGAGNS
jgi:hypothetical protein